MVKKALKIPFGLGITSIGTNILGSRLGQQLPPGTLNPLTSIGASVATAAGLTGTIALTGVVLDETRKLNPRNKSNKNKFKVPNVQLVRDYGKKVPL